MQEDSKLSQMHKEEHKRKVEELQKVAAPLAKRLSKENRQHFESHLKTFEDPNQKGAMSAIEEFIHILGQTDGELEKLKTDATTFKATAEAKMKEYEDMVTKLKEESGKAAADSKKVAELSQKKEDATSAPSAAPLPATVTGGNAAATAAANVPTESAAYRSVEMATYSHPLAAHYASSRELNMEQQKAFAMAFQRAQSNPKPFVFQ
jgi:hypothetical protein